MGNVPFRPNPLTPGEGGVLLSPLRGGAKGEVNPPTSGTQNHGKPSAREGGQTEVQGAQAPWQGVWGMCPQNFQKGASCPH